MCGFANAQGGTIYIGIDDAGNVVGVYELVGTTLRIRFKALSSALIDMSKVPKCQRAKPDGILDDTMALMIIEEIRSKPNITLDQLSEEVGIARRTLVRYMSALKKTGRIERVGGKRYGHWEVR